MKTLQACLTIDCASVCPKQEMRWLSMWLLMSYPKARTTFEVWASTMLGTPVQGPLVAPDPVRYHSLIPPRRAWFSFPHLHSVRVCAWNRICRLLWGKRKKRKIGPELWLPQGLASGCQLGTQIQLQIVKIQRRWKRCLYEQRRAVFLHLVNTCLLSSGKIFRNA